MAYINKPVKKKNDLNIINEKNLAQKLVYNTKRWARLRALKIHNNPLCEECFKNDLITPVVDVHHITPFMNGVNIEQIKWLAFDYNNLMCLCEKCHQMKHRK